MTENEKKEHKMNRNSILNSSNWDLRITYGTFLERIKRTFQIRFIYKSVEIN